MNKTNDFDFKLPEIEKGTVIPPQIVRSIAEKEQIRKDNKRSFLISLLSIIIAALSLAVSIIAIFLG